MTGDELAVLERIDVRLNDLSKAVEDLSRPLSPEIRAFLADYMSLSEHDKARIRNTVAGMAMIAKLNMNFFDEHQK